MRDGICGVNTGMILNLQKKNEESLIIKNKKLYKGGLSYGRPSFFMHQKRDMVKIIMSS